MGRCRPRGASHEPRAKSAPANEPPPSAGLKSVKEENCVSCLFFARWEPCLPAADRPKQQDRPASARDTAAGLSDAVHLHSFRTQSTSRKAGTKSTHFCVSPLRTELSKYVRMPGKDRSKRAIRLLEQADRCLEALSQILPLPAMTGRGIVVHYDLF